MMNTDTDISSTTAIMNISDTLSVTNILNVFDVL